MKGTTIVSQVEKRLTAKDKEEGFHFCHSSIVSTKQIRLSSALGDSTKVHCKCDHL
jgi:hypothetical protein